jgi:hypothetical protein
LVQRAHSPDKLATPEWYSVAGPYLDHLVWNSMRGMQKLPRFGQQDKHVHGSPVGRRLIPIHHVADHPDSALRTVRFQLGPSDWNRGPVIHVFCGIEFGQIATHVDRNDYSRAHAAIVRKNILFDTDSATNDGLNVM